ncbi:MAG: hypothetical protein M3Z96_14805 [Pseudomonadota bacterium]|nr:hypothetical protein [Pseudomonadota bacterium]
MTDLPRSYPNLVYNPWRPQGKVRAKAAKANLLADLSRGVSLRHHAVIAIFYVRFDHGMLIYHVPWSRAGPEVRPAFCVS